MDIHNHPFRVLTAHPSVNFSSRKTDELKFLRLESEIYDTTYQVQYQVVNDYINATKLYSGVAKHAHQGCES